MCSSLKGLVTETADVTAVLAVGLSTVPSQCIGILAHLIAVVTLVPIICLRLAIFPFMAIISNLDQTQGLMSNIFTKAHAYTSIVKKMSILIIYRFFFFYKRILGLPCTMAISWGSSYLKIENIYESLKFRHRGATKIQSFCDECVLCIFETASDFLFMLIWTSIGRHYVLK